MKGRTRRRITSIKRVVNCCAGGAAEHVHVTFLENVPQLGEINGATTTVDGAGVADGLGVSYCLKAV